MLLPKNVEARLAMWEKKTVFYQQKDTFVGQTGLSDSFAEIAFQLLVAYHSFPNKLPCLFGQIPIIFQLHD